jgi:hypothetical protein
MRERASAFEVVDFSHVAFVKHNTDTRVVKQARARDPPTGSDPPPRAFPWCEHGPINDRLQVIAPFWDAARTRAESIRFLPNSIR